MQLRPSLLIAVLTLWFALLQSMAPLLHAHLNGEHALDDGPHMHLAELNTHEEVATQAKHAFHWHIHANKTPGMVLGLTPALTEQGWQLPHNAPIWLIWLTLPALCIAAILISAILQLRLRGWQALPLKRRTLTPLNFTSPRAPPTL